MEETTQILRHIVATLAYRTQKAVRDAPDEFGSYRVTEGVRTTNELLRHMTHALRWATQILRQVEAPIKEPRLLPGLNDEMIRFHATLAELSGEMARQDLSTELTERVLQGPLSDALTHAGQISLLRRLSGSPLQPENFSVAKVSAENLSPDQAAPVQLMPGLTAEEESQRYAPREG